MTESLLAASDLAELLLGSAFLVFLRVGAIMAMLPAFGERSIPVRVRLVMTLLFTALVAPAVIADFPEPATARDLVPLAMIEIVAGLSLGIVLRMIVIALQIAGTIAANATSLSQILGGASVDPQPAMAHILVVAGLALAAMTQLHVKVTHAMIESYLIFPAGAAIASADLSSWGVSRIADAFALAFTLSAPFVIVSVIYNLALGAINRAMPQLMVAFVGAPAITMGGLLLLLYASPFLLEIWRREFDTLLDGFGI